MTGSEPSRVMSIAQPLVKDLPYDSKRGKVEIWSALSFFDKDKIGPLWPYDDALIVTLKIEGFDVKTVLVD